MGVELTITESAKVELNGLQEALDMIGASLSELKARADRQDNQLTRITLAVDILATTLAENTASDIRLEAIVSDLSTVVTDLETQVSQQTTVIGGTTTLLDGLTTIISDLRDDLESAGVDPALVARLSGVRDAVSEGTATLGAAVLRNTPAENTEPVPGDGGTPTTPDV
jgi:chromosome segregation ATPase